MTASTPSVPTFPKLRTILWQALRSLTQNGGALLGLCGVALLWAGVLHSLSAEREQALRSAAQETSNLTRTFEETIVRSIKAIDQSLLYIRDAYQKDPDGFDIDAWTKSTQAVTDMTFQISLIGRDGMMRSSNLATPGKPVDLSDREHFRVHRDSAADELFISKPVLGRVSKKLSLQLTRKKLTADNEFDGVIVISLDPSYLSRFYDSVELGSQGEVMLVGVDGVVRAGARGGQFVPARESTTDSAIGRSLADGRLMAEYARQPTGAYDAPSAVDGVKRVTAYRAVRGTPLIVAVGIAEDEVLSASYANGRSYFALASLLTALLLSFTVLIVVRQVRFNQTRAQLETTLEHMTQGIMMIDPGLRIQVCNRQAQDMLDLPRAMMAGRPRLADMLGSHAGPGQSGHDGRGLDGWLRGFLQADALPTEASSYEWTRPDESVLEIRSTPLPGGGLVRTFTDITARKQTERVLRTARDESDRAVRAKTEFLATMSHEIRSPMSGLLGVLELLRSTDLDADQTHMADMVHNAAAALLAVLNDILDFSKFEAGAMNMTAEPTRLRDLFTELVQPHAAVAAVKGVELRLHLGADVPDRAVIDNMRLRQILSNLLSNATKFTAVGTIGVQVNVTANVVAPTLRVVISDTGVGMTADVIGRLFEPFMQADGSTSRHFGGTGLGLCIAKRMARLLGGDLGATSEHGKGSAFVLSLPLFPDTEVEAIVDRSDCVGPHGWIGRGRALVADDDLTNRWLSQRQLELLGLSVDVAEDGLTAFVKLQAARYDMLLTDCHMPGLDGVALTLMIRASPDPMLRALPIIGLTADVTATQRERCQDAGMTELAIKPLTLRGLASLVSRYLDGTPGLHDPGVVPEPQTSSTDPATFDSTIYHELFPPGDPEGAGWLGEYLDVTVGMVHTVDQIMGTAGNGALDRVGLASIAHRLAGSSLSVGATALGEQARTLEHRAATADLAALREAQIALADEFAAATRAITVFASSNQTEPVA